MLFGSIMNTQLASNYKGYNQSLFALFPGGTHIFLYAGHITHAFPLRNHNQHNFFFFLTWPGLLLNPAVSFHRRWGFLVKQHYVNMDCNIPKPTVSQQKIKRINKLSLEPSKSVRLPQQELPVYIYFSPSSKDKTICLSFTVTNK